MVKVRLSAKRLEEAIAVISPENEFTFIVGREEREYACSLVEACFISGKVCRLVSSDPTIKILRVLPDEQCDDFELIERLWRGGSVTVSNENAESLSKLSSDLENEELSSILIDFDLSNETISVSNCISRLHLKTRLGFDSRAEIEFISSNFFEFKDLSDLKVSELERILVQDSLTIDNENSLLDCILELVSRDGAYASLFKYVQFEYLDSAHLDQFLGAVYPDYIDSVIWDSISKFIMNSVKNSPPSRLSNKRLRIQKDLFQYDSSSPFNGIFSFLRMECGKNPHQSGCINITASSNDSPPHRVIDYGWNSWLCTNNIANSWIQFDFKDREVSLESYTIKSDGNATLGRDHLRQWKIEGSNDASSWAEFDSRNTNDLNGTYVTKHFTCSNVQRGTFFRYIRLTQTGTNMSGAHQLRLSEIEFFGTLRSQ